MNSRNLENRRSFIAPPARDARVSLGVRAARDARSGLGARAAWGARAGRGVRVFLGARGTQVNLSAGTAETIEENS